MLTIEDLEVINAALCSNVDVRIKATPDGGYRILSETVKVLKKSQSALQGPPPKNAHLPMPLRKPL